jgi:hypothetical protein
LVAVRTTSGHLTAFVEYTGSTPSAATCTQAKVTAILYKNGVQTLSKTLSGTVVGGSCKRPGLLNFTSAEIGNVPAGVNARFALQALAPGGAVTKVRITVDGLP